MKADLFNRLTNPNPQIDYATHLKFWKLDEIPSFSISVREAILELFSSNPIKLHSPSYYFIQLLLAREFPFQAFCTSSIPEEVSEKAKGAFWYSFLDLFSEGEMDELLNSKEFKEGGVIYMMAEIDTLINALIHEK